MGWWCCCRQFWVGVGRVKPFRDMKPFRFKRSITVLSTETYTMKLKGKSELLHAMPASYLIEREQTKWEKRNFRLNRYATIFCKHNGQIHNCDHIYEVRDNLVCIFRHTTLPQILKTHVRQRASESRAGCSIFVLYQCMSTIANWPRLWNSL